MKRLVLTLSLTLAAVGLLAAPALANQVVKATGSNSFRPATAHVSMGEKVIWKNVTMHSKHSVTATSSNWTKDKTIQPGTKTSFVFNANGTYRYKCVFHGGMTGKVVVG